MNASFQYAEICAQLDGEQFAISIGPFLKRPRNSVVFACAKWMGLDPVRTCEPIWSKRTRRLEP